MYGSYGQIATGKLPRGRRWWPWTCKLCRTSSCCCPGKWRRIETSGDRIGIRFIPNLVKPSLAEASVAWLAHSRVVSTGSQRVRLVMANLW